MKKSIKTWRTDFSPLFIYGLKSILHNKSISRYTKISIYLSIIILIGSCAKPPEYPVIPAITFKGMTKTTMKGGQRDTTYVTISFTDGDGDIGNGTDEVGENIFFIDLRQPKTIAEQNKLPLIPQGGAKNGVSGEITVLIPSACCRINKTDVSCDNRKFPALYPTDTIRYKIYIQDRAGNKSNEVETPPIYLQCN